MATYAVVAAGLLALRVVVPWMGGGGPVLHTLIEGVSATLALAAGLLALLHHHASPRNKLLFLGGGFVGAGLLDAYHAIATSPWLLALWPSAPANLIPWSWSASRTFLALLGKSAILPGVLTMCTSSADSLGDVADRATAA